MKSVHHYQRATIADLINPDEGHRGEMLRKGRQIKNGKEEKTIIRRRSRSIKFYKCIFGMSEVFWY